MPKNQSPLPPSSANLTWRLSAPVFPPIHSFNSVLRQYVHSNAIRGSSRSNQTQLPQDERKKFPSRISRCCTRLPRFQTSACQSSHLLLGSQPPIFPQRFSFATKSFFFPSFFDEFFFFFFVWSFFVCARGANAWMRGDGDANGGNGGAGQVRDENCHIFDSKKGTKEILFSLKKSFSKSLNF